MFFEVNLSIIVPLFNEAESVEELARRIQDSVSALGLSYEIILVDDGSTDGTWDIIDRLGREIPQLRAIKFRRNYGQTSAMVAGFDHARGEVIVTLDGDLQNDPADIPNLLDRLAQGYDIASGWRKARRDGAARVLLSRLANAIISATTGVRLHDYGCSLKAYRAECIKSIKPYGEMHRFLPALARMTGARVAEIPVRHHPRKHGVSKYGFDRVWKVFVDILALNLIIRFSSTPLRGFAICAVPFALLTLFFGGLGVLALLADWTAGKALFFMIASALTCMAAVHLIALGVLGELVVGTSDLTHTQLPEITKKVIFLNGGKNTRRPGNGPAGLREKPGPESPFPGLSKPEPAWSIAVRKNPVPKH